MDSGEIQPSTGLRFALFEQPCLLISRNSVLQHETSAQPISAGVLRTFMGYKRWRLLGIDIYFVYI